MRFLRHKYLTCDRVSQRNDIVIYSVLSINRVRPLFNFDNLILIYYMKIKGEII